MNDNVVPFRKSREMAKKAVILCRVSSKEQEDGYSIDAQNHRLRFYCDKNDLAILEVFELVESSTRGDREDFMAMIKFVKNQKETIAIVADKVDRVQRSFKEYPLLDALVQEGKIELHFNTENYIIHKDSVSQERLMWSMGVIMAQSYIENMKDNVKRSFEQKIRQGEIIGLAPLGYKNVKDAKGRGDVVIDMDRSFLIGKIFETYATGACTLMELRQKTVDWGLRNRNKRQANLSKSQLHRIICNPFYYGKMNIKGHLYTHRYEPIISQDLFDQCQAVLNGWKKKPFQSVKKEFVFRGLLTCATSGRIVSSETQKKTYVSGKTAQWIYLRCSDPTNPNKRMWVREDRILEQVTTILKSLYIQPSGLMEIRSAIKQLSDIEKDFVQRQASELKKEYMAIQTKLDRLTDLLIDSAIERKEYDERKNKLCIQQERIETLIAANDKGDDSFKECLLALFAVVSGAYDLFIGSTTAEKRLMLNFMFSNLSLKGDKLLYSFRKPFDEFHDSSKMMKWRELIDKFRTDPYLRHEIITLCKIHNLIERFGTNPCSA